MKAPLVLNFPLGGSGVGGNIPASSSLPSDSRVLEAEEPVPNMSPSSEELSDTRTTTYSTRELLLTKGPP